MDGRTGNEILDQLREQMRSCRSCVLRKSCHQVVPGVGPANSRIVICGEASGQDEDKKGEPFVGLAGQLLNKMLKSAGLKRETIYITNVVHCRPPGNRRPTPQEVDSCKHWLLRELQLIRPKVVVALGKTAARLLLKGDRNFYISRYVNQMHRPVNMGGIPVVCLYHPAYLLRGNEKEIDECVRSLIKVRNFIR